MFLIIIVRKTQEQSNGEKSTSTILPVWPGKILLGIKLSEFTVNYLRISPIFLEGVDVGTQKIV